MKLFGFYISKSPPDPELLPGEIPVYAVLHPDGRIAYLGQTEAAADDMVRNTWDDRLYVLKLAARPIRAT